MGMRIRPDFPPWNPPARKARPGDTTESGGERGRGVDPITGVTVVEFRIPSWDTGDESWGGQQGTIRLSGWDLNSRWRTGEIIEVESFGGEATVACCRYCR